MAVGQRKQPRHGGRAAITVPGLVGFPGCARSMRGTGRRPTAFMVCSTPAVRGRGGFWRIEQGSPAVDFTDVESAMRTNLIIV